MRSPPLPVGFVVHSEYVIERLLGHGGFGFTYRALHRSLDVSVALKEFFPFDLVTRRADQTVEPISPDKAEAFESAKAAIFGEAQALARLKHDGIVGVFGVFEHQGTVYSVLENIDGTSVASWLGNRKTSPDQAELDRISNKVLDALALVHDHGLLHRDIVPINILLRSRDGMPVLIDFRSAIKITPAKITAIATGSYAPYELAVDDINAQGPWTDIYSFAAVLHRVVTGQDPPETLPRMIRDPYIPLAHRVGPGRYRPSFLNAIDWGLAASPKARPQDVRSWRGRLLPKLASETADTGRAVGTKIFISYRRADTAKVAQRIYDRLATEFGSDDVFFDVETIPVGVDFRKHIEVRILQSAVVLAIIGHRWLRPPGWFGRLLARTMPEDHVMTEIEFAFNHGVPILPILLDDASIPDSQDLPLPARALADLNGRRLQSGGDFNRDFESVLSVVKSLKSHNSD
jgi:serine/threonine protein kinase